MLSLLLLSGALAFESECRSESDAGAYGGHNADPSASICADPDAPKCEAGLDAARGVQLGEHTWLTRAGMAAAGLHDQRTWTFLDAWGSSQTVAKPGGGTLPSLAPSALANLSARVTRPTVIAELAQVPDASHTFSDWLLGNEHCTVPGLPTGTPAAIQSCHTFNPHMGAVNSTHFPPQSEAMSATYHQAALAVATRCKAMDVAFDAAASHSLADEAQDVVRACEREALALEAVASHYLEDSWASGHMWQRWGVPVAPTSGQARINLSAVAVVSGIIHGWRSVVREYLDVTDIPHDRLSLPGPFDDGDDEPIVRFTGPGWTAPQPGGGDLYVLPCNAYEQSRDWALSTGSALKPQHDRLVACVAAGFAAVYDAGPRTAGNRAPPASPDASITSSTQPECGGQRVTNQSFVLGMQMADTFTLADPGIGARFVLGFAVGDQASSLEALGVTEPQVDRSKRQLRADLARIAFHARRRAARAPDATDLAELEHPSVRRILGVPRNGDTTIGPQSPPYLERSAPSAWDDGVYGSCETDADCATNLPGFWCDTSDPDGASCRSPESALLRAFRKAELPYWCRSLGSQDLDRVRESCVRGTSAAACDACVEVVLPHLRNACSARSLALLEQESPPADRRSLCDVLEDAGTAGTYEASPAYALFSPASAAEGRAAARELCETPPADRPNVPGDDDWVPEVTPVQVDLHTGAASTTVDVVSHGPMQEVQWSTASAHASVTATPATWTTGGVAPTTVTLSTDAPTTPRLVDVQIWNACAPSYKTSVLVAVGDVTHITFDDASGFPAADQWAALGLASVTSDQTLLGLSGDDSIGTASICGANSGYCNGNVHMTFAYPCSDVSFYVGDRELDTRNAFSIVVRDTAGGVLQSISPSVDRRFYSFRGSIGGIDFTASSDAELIDELTLVPEEVRLRPRLAARP